MNNGHSSVTRNANIGYGMPWTASGKEYWLMFLGHVLTKHAVGCCAYYDISNID
jgi:hypothetical protein